MRKNKAAVLTAAGMVMMLAVGCASTSAKEAETAAAKTSQVKESIGRKSIK